MKSVVLHIKRNSKGFGLSLIYRGLDKYEEADTGVFVARVVPGGMSEKYGLRWEEEEIKTVKNSVQLSTRENDRVLSINNIWPKSVEEAVGIIKEAGKHLEVLVERRGEKPARREQQGKAGSSGRTTRLEPPQHFTFNNVQQQQYNRHSESCI